MMTLFVTWFLRKFTVKVTLLVALAVNISACAVVTFSTSYYIMLFARFIQGIS
jgi:predicted MFS family arabinose efflux permease